jgi:DNA invertase Pin-like site-specific DNA recombinase
MGMATYGYARVSSAGQDYSTQVDRLKAAGCTVVRAEKISGTSRQGRAELDTLLSFLQSGDTLMVTKIDRLARSVLDLQTIVQSLTERGVALRATDQPVDTSDAAGRAFLQMLGVFAEFETAIRKERQLDGIAKAKGAGVYKGRKRSIKPTEVQALKAEGLAPDEIADRLKISRASVYRALAATAAE